jgi:hypothetical protein
MANYSREAFEMSWRGSATSQPHVDRNAGWMKHPIPSTTTKHLTGAESVCRNTILVNTGMDEDWELVPGVAQIDLGAAHAPRV